MPKLPDESEDQYLARLMANGGHLLVTTCLREMPYAEYLRTNHWDKIRTETLRRAKWRCSICLASVPLDAHHITYDRRGSELPGDTIALCRPCHTAQEATLRAVMSAEFNQQFLYE